MMLKIFDDWFQESVDLADWLGFSERWWYLGAAVEVLPMGVGEEDT